MASTATAQQPPAPSTPATPASPPANPGLVVPANPKITGKREIRFSTRTDRDGDAPKAGVVDVYTDEMNVANVYSYQGQIQHLPTIFSSVLGRETQQAELKYDMIMNSHNPKNPAQKMAVGKMVGTVKINKEGEYQYNSGNLRMMIDTKGKVQGFTSPFTGTAQGIPPTNASWLANRKADVAKAKKTITKVTGGKTTELVLTKYDPMRFPQITMAAGPEAYLVVTNVTGDMIYDYDHSAWHFDNVVISYEVDDLNTPGKKIPFRDVLTGNIRWVPNPQRLTNGEGQYEFDIRVNAPDPGKSAGAAFESASTGSFWDTDPTIPCLTGTVKYKDTIRRNSTGDEEDITVTSSSIAIDLTGNQLNVQQLSYLDRLLNQVCVVPMNSE